MSYNQVSFTFLLHRNLEEALNYYFDYQSSSKVPQMMLLQDEMADGVFRNVLPNTE